MKSIKWFCLVAVAAVVGLSLASTASASAATTVLCKVNVVPCPVSPIDQRWENVGFEMKATNFRLLTFGPTGETLCEAATIKGKLLTFGSPQKVTITGLTFTNCKFGKTACEIVEAIPGALDLLRTNVNLGEATFLSTEIFVNCGGIIHCEFDLEGKMHLQGSESAEKAAVISVSGLVIKPESGEACPSKTMLTATYSVLQPFPAFVSS